MEAERSAARVPHLDRACELLWHAGHPRIGEALDQEVGALARAAVAVLDEARRSGSVTVKAREDLAEALGLPREAARGRWHGWHGGTGEERAAAKERLERAWGDRYEQDAKDEASAATVRCPNCGRIACGCTAPPGGVYLYVHSSLCASNATGHGPCTCNPTWRHKAGLGERHPYG